MKKWMLLGILLFAGCRGKQGETGVQGLRGPGSFEMLSGSVTSDDFDITDSKIAQAKDVTVYLSSGGEMVELPIFLPASGVNAIAVVNKGTSSIQIINGSLAGASSYLVVLII